MSHPTGPSLSSQAMAGMVRGRAAPYLDGLNDPQSQAVQAVQGPVLVLSGAGTGKTRVLTARIAHLIATGNARPNEILAVTFTNKAAREMRLRLAGLLGDAVEGMPWLGTFHAIGVKLLRRHAELVGLKPGFTILDTDDQLRLLKQVIAASNIDEKRFPPRALASLIDHWKNRAWRPESVPASEAGAFDNRGTELYAAYQDRLRTLNCCDFGDLLLHVVTIFQSHPQVLAQYQRWLRFILVDEYQDTNVAQYLWLRLLAGTQHNICCVGDDDQSIYGWRGAEVGNILRFERDFPGAQVIRLEQNYRSTEHILAAASGVIATNEGRLGKTLWTESKGGEKVRLIGHWDGEEEARWMGERIEALLAGDAPEARERKNPRSRSIVQEFERLAKKGALGGARSPADLFEIFRSQNSPLREFKTRQLMWELSGRHAWSEKDPAFYRFSHEEIAILVRASHQMRAFEDRFLTIGLPYRVVGGPRFYERLEIRDAMAYFRLAVQPTDDLAFERVVNTPKRGLGDKAQQSIQKAARAAGVPLLQGAAIVLADGQITGRAAGALRGFVEQMARWHDMVRAGGDHIRLAETILDESGYTAMWQADTSPDSAGRLDNLKELVKALENFDNLQGFLEHVALVMDNETDDAAEKVTLMTLHAAKGLEFPVVFLPGWEDGLFPSQRSMDEQGRKGLEEERRLAYVGITRAEELCTISFAANRRVHGQWQSQFPSRFIDELPPAHVDPLTPPGLQGGGYGAAGMSRSASVVEARAARADVYASPGWQRLQRQTPAIPAPVSPATRTGATHSFRPGERVLHDRFGTGTVRTVDGDKLGVAFDRAGEKHIVARFVIPAEGVDDVPF